MQARYTHGVMIVLGVVAAFVVGAARARAQEGKWRVQAEFRDKYGGAYSMTAAAAVDTVDCMVMGWSADENTIWKTTDGGATWRVVRSDVLADNLTHYDAMARPARSLVVIVGDSGRVLRSTDGGETWSYGLCDITYGPEPQQRQRLIHLSMLDSLHGVATGYTKLLARTDDGGATWQRMPIPQTPTILTIFDALCLQPGVHLLVGYSGGHYSVFRTEDSGVSWSRVDVDSLRTVRFLDSLNGWGIGYGESGVGDETVAIVAKTTDGGRTWRTIYNQHNDGDFGLRSVAFADRDHGMAIGSGGVPIRTADGGETWKAGPDLQSQLSVLNTTCVTYPAPDKAWVVSVVGQVLVWDNSPAAGVDRGATPMGADRLIAAPNPMRSSGAIDYAIIERGHVRLALVDLLGREVRILVDGAQDAGLHTIGIDVTGITPGIYFLRMRHGGESIVRRIVVE